MPKTFFYWLLQYTKQHNCTSWWWEGTFVTAFDLRHSDLGDSFWVTDLQHGLLVLMMVHVNRGQVYERPFHIVLIRVVEEGMWLPHDDVAFDPFVGAGLQNMYVTFLGNDGAAG